MQVAFDFELRFRVEVAVIGESRWKVSNCVSVQIMSFEATREGDGPS